MAVNASRVIASFKARFRRDRRRYAFPHLACASAASPCNRGPTTSRQFLNLGTSPSLQKRALHGNIAGRPRRLLSRHLSDVAFFCRWNCFLVSRIQYIGNITTSSRPSSPASLSTSASAVSGDSWLSAIFHSRTLQLPGLQVCSPSSVPRSSLPIAWRCESGSVFMPQRGCYGQRQGIARCQKTRLPRDIRHIAVNADDGPDRL
jgi:hypothetical protein